MKLEPVEVKRENAAVKTEALGTYSAQTCCDGQEKVEGGVKLEPVEVKRENAAVKTEALGTYSAAQRAALLALCNWRWENMTQQ